MKTRSAETQEHPIYDVRLRKESQKFPLHPDTDEESRMAPYRTVQPSPFYYRTDVQRAAGKVPFLIAGVNCDSTIEKITSITGVEIGKLEQRASPAGFLTSKDANGPYGDSFWGSSTNRGQRISTDGFLDSNQSLRETLLKDNKTVRELGLTHQDIAAPIIQAMLQMQRSVLLNKNISLNDDFDFEYPESNSKKTFKVSVTDMQDLEIDPRKHPELYREKYKISGDLKELVADFRKRTKRYTSGWIGWGVQGSFFDDDLFASCILTFTAPNGEKLTVDCLTAQLIYRYGFYQGGKYRVAPDKIASFFNVPESSKSKALWEEGCPDTK